MWAFRLVTRRRLGLPISLGGHGGSKHDKVFDSFGDVAQNDGLSGHQTRHFMLLDAVFKAFRSVWGGRVAREPSNYQGYSDTRPDVGVEGVGSGGGMLLADVKFLDSVGSDGAPALRGAMVGMGNTEPRARETVHGLRQRGAPEDRRHNPKTGKGFVKEKKGQYTRAEAAGCTVVCALFEVWGGWGQETEAVFQQCAQDRQNKLTGAEYDDEATWSTRTWLSFQAQKISVALHYAAALEISKALGLATAGDAGARGD